MVDSSRRRSSRRSMMSSHNRCWIWGRNVVLETLRAGRWPVLELAIGDRAAQQHRDEAIHLANNAGVEIVNKSDDELANLCRANDHQGFAARMTPFPCNRLEDVLRQLPANPFVVILDRLQDPFNFGAMIRSASALGVDAIVIGEREQCEINSQVARSSAGAVNHILIGQASSLVEATMRLRDIGLQIVAASEKADRMIDAVDFVRSTAVLIGNEGRGVHSDLLSLCDAAVSIPMSGSVGSLNAAVAAGILFYEMRRQRTASANSR